MTKDVSKTLKSQNPHVEAARRLRRLAQILASNPAEAQAFRLKTGVFNAQGELEASY